MNNTKKGTGWMVRVALLVAIVILLANTPLGMIQLPIIKATTVHIPVIIGAILLGPWQGPYWEPFLVSALCSAIPTPLPCSPLPSRHL